VDVSRSDAHRLLYLEAERAVAERQPLLALVSRGDTVVDVGANVGYIALLLAERVGFSGRIVCIEPDPENLRELRRNAALNPQFQLAVLPLAASDSDSTVTMRRGLNASVRCGGDGDLEVECRRLDSLDLGAVHALKVDVEGHELAVLRGGRNLLRTQRPGLFIEMHPGLVPVREDLEAVLELLEASGYREMTGYRYARGGGLPARVFRRISGAGGLERTRDIREWIRAGVSGAESESFWLVATGEQRAAMDSKAQTLSSVRSSGAS